MQQLERPLRAITLAVVGRPFPNADGSDRGREILLCQPGEPVELRPEPKNKHDPRAMAVISCRGVQIGYINAERAGRIGAILRSGREVKAVFQEECDFGAWIRVAFDGGHLTLPARSAALPAKPSDDGWFPDEVWPDEFEEGRDG